MPDSLAQFRFGMSAPAAAGVDAVVDMAVRAEHAGFDTVTVPDLPGFPSPLITLTAAAWATTAIHVGTFVLNTGLWNPDTIARELATLDQASDGRLEITLGSGIPQPALSGIIPADPQGRFERLRATVEAVKSALVSPGLAPAFTGRPRLLIAGGADRTLRLAAAEADGFIIASVPPVPKIKLPPGQLVLPEPAAAEAFLARLHGYAGERASRLEVGTGAEVIVTDDAQAAAERLAGIHAYLTPEQILASPKILIGTLDEIAAQILDRGQRLGLTYYVLRGAPPEDLAALITRVRAG